MFAWLLRLLVGAALVGAAMGLLRAGMKWWIDGPDVEPSSEPWPPLAEVPPLAEGSAPALHEVPSTPLDSTWVAPDNAGEALTSYPVKVKESSRLYHLPGMLAYDRTRPDRCYSSAEAAEADGFVRAKR